jgi:large subunit ribosomal protein L10
MATQEKEQEIAGLNEKFKKMGGMIVTSYQGLNVGELCELRKDLKKINSQYIVVKNTFATIALKELKMEGLAKELTGPTAVLVINGDPVSAAKKIISFSKEHEHLKIKSGFIFDKIVSAEEIGKIAVLPSREVLLGKFTGVLKMTLVGFVNVLQAPIRKLVYTLDAASRKK